MPMPRRAVLSGSASLVALAFALIVGGGSLPAGCAGEVPCEFNSDCVIGYCVGGTCQKDCVDAERDCPAGFLCNDNAQCVPGSTSTTGGGGVGGTGNTTTTSNSGSTTSGTTSSETGGTGGTGSTTSTTSTTTTTSSSSTTGNPTGKHELDLCATDAECAPSLVCRQKVAGNQKRCTRACGSNAQCMTGTRCEAVGAEHICIQSDTGKACTAAANTCNFACLNDQYCTSECNDGHDCPGGYGCMDIPPYRICAKAEADCSAADTSKCAVDYCDESASMYVGGCTTPCNSAGDCPQRALPLAPWQCSGGACTRPADVHGPVQGGATPAQYVNDCQGNVVNVCNDGLNIDFGAFAIPSPPAAQCGATMTTDGIPTDSCLNSCRYQGGCSFGFACTGVGNLGAARIGLCFPTGNGEVGAACANDTQCLYGYCNQNKCSRDCSKDGVCPTGSTCVAGGAPTVDGLAFRRCQ